MPRPPNPNSFTQINFVVNYALLGCTPPFWVFIECAKEPAKDLFLLLILPDPIDIGQAIFEPEKGRKRKPARHGRKKGRGVKFPDTSDMIGQRARGVLNPGDAIKYSPVRRLFPIINAVEAVGITTAVLEGLSQVGYDGVLGAFKLDPSDCLDLDFVQRESDFQKAQGGAGPPIDAFPLPQLIKNVGFVQSQLSVLNTDKPYTANISVTLRPNTFTPEDKVSVALGTDVFTKRAQSSVVTFNGQETKTIDVSADFEAGETCVWGLGERFGFFQIIEARFVAFSNNGFPWNW